MKTAKLLLSILLAGIILAAGCVGKQTNQTATGNAGQGAAPADESITVDTSSIDAGINDANSEQSEILGDVNESALDLGI